MDENNSIPSKSQALYLIDSARKSTPETLEKALGIHVRAIQNAQLARKTQTAVRIWVAGAGGPKRQGDRVTDAEKRKIDDFLAKFDFAKFWGCDPFEILEKGFAKLKVGARSRNTYRHAFKQMITFFQQQGWDPREQPKTEYLRLCRPRGSGYKKSGRPGWQRAGKIILTEKESPSQINEEMAVFKEFCLNQLDISPLAYYEDFIRRYVGMLHREGMPLEELSLTKIVPYVKSGQTLTMTEVVNGEIFADHPIVKRAISEGRYFEASAVAKELCREQEAEVVKHVESLFDNFAKYTTAQSCARLTELEWIIRLARFVYRDDIRELGQECIPLLRFLKKRRRQLEIRAQREKPRVPYEEKSLSREQLLALVHHLKRIAMQDREYRGKRKLAISTRALHMQTFLAIALFSVLPPRRYRVLYELEPGRTLRRGLRVDKRFMAEAELADPSQAQWYYYLSAEDYKTGKFKGECWVPIPNWEFVDSTSLYDYIDLWLNELRPRLNPASPHFFVNTGLTSSVQGSRLAYETIREWMLKATEKHTGILVPPKEFRKMYVSYVKSLPDITEAELEAIAAAMGHSRQMQEQVYNQLGHDETVSPVIDFQQRINASYLDDIG